MTENKAETFDITDRWTIAALEACGHVAALIHAEDEKTFSGKSRPTLVYSFPESAKSDYELWMRNENTEPFVTVRKVQQSALQFKNNLYRHCR